MNTMQVKRGNQGMYHIRLFLIGMLIGVAFQTFAHIDVYPSINTYGVSVGTNTHYCSLELTPGLMFPVSSCEAAS